MFAYNSVAVACVEPHCDIECSMTYDVEENDAVIYSTSLSKIQQQHLMIDIGNDSLVNDLINSMQSPKICPYRNQSSPLSERSINMTVEFYPLLFGFVDRYLLSTKRRQISINNQMHTVEQMCLPKKSKDFSDLIPGKRATYKFGFENELDYRRSYTAAYFAVTTKKGGWDCNRHYEIVSSGTVPYFDNLNLAGKHTLSLLPKTLLYEAQKIPGVQRENLTINHTLFDTNRYNLLLHRLLYYAKYRLTTVRIIEYILKVIEYSLNYSQRRPVLYIAHEKCDYMKDFMLHGFTRIFEENLHVFRPPKYLYDYPVSKQWTAKETSAYYGKALYGFGFGFKLSLKKYVHLYTRDKKDLPSENVVQKNIENKNYSLIVFGSILRENRLFSITAQHYERSKIILIDGEDARKDHRRSEYAKHGYYFLREIPDDCDQFM